MGLSSADEAFAAVVLAKGVVAPKALDDRKRAIARGEPGPLAQDLVKRGLLDEKTRAELERIRAQHGRPCASCGKTTFLLPGESSEKKPCEHCGGKLMPARPPTTATKLPPKGSLGAPPPPPPAPLPKKPESTRAPANDGKTADDWASEGAAFGKDGHPEDALLCFEKALAKDANHGAAWAGKVACLSQLGRHEDALETIKQGRSIAGASEPLKRTTRKFAMTALAALGRHSEAFELAKAAIGANAEDAQAWLTKAESEVGLGKRAEALRSVRKLLTLITPDHKLHARATELSEDLEVGE